MMDHINTAKTVTNYNAMIHKTVKIAYPKWYNGVMTETKITMPKLKRLYVRKSAPLQLIACHGGSHYVSQETSVFTVEDKVNIFGVKGDATVTVTSFDGAREEVFNLKSSYAGVTTVPVVTEKKVAKKSATPKTTVVKTKATPKTRAPKVSENETVLDRRLREAQERLANRAA